MSRCASVKRPDDGEGARDVGGEALVLGARVDEQEVAVAQLRVVLDVVEDGRVRAGADDGRCRPAPTAPLRRKTYSMSASISYSFMPGRAARIASRCASAAISAARRMSAISSADLDEAHLVEDGAGVDDGLTAGACRDAPCARMRASCRTIWSVEVGVAVAETVVEAARAVESSRELFAELRDGERGVRAVSLFRALDAGAPAVPDLALGVARADEERVLVLGVRGRDDGDGLGLAEAREVVEVRVLPEAVLRVVRAASPRARPAGWRPSPAPCAA